MSNIFDISCGQFYYLIMAVIAELGALVRRRRADMGLTQATVAALSGLSRATVNKLENGAVETDLSLNRAARLAEALGLSLTIAPPEEATAGKSPALDIAARTASVSYRVAMQPTQLRRMLKTGEVSPAFLPHVNAVLDEAPVSLLAQVVEQLHVEEGLERPWIWKQMRVLARQVKSSRSLWQ